MKPWRERLRDAALSSLKPEEIARLDRVDQAHFAAITVFGNDADAGRWYYGTTAEFGGWRSPEAVAAESDEGLAMVLAKLEAMKATVTPKPDPFPTTSAGRRRVFKARRSPI